MTTDLFLGKFRLAVPRNDGADPLGEVNGLIRDKTDDLAAAKCAPCLSMKRREQCSHYRALGCWCWRHPRRAVGRRIRSSANARADVTTEVRLRIVARLRIS